MSRNVIYWGLFLIEDRPALLEPVQHQHVTFGFRTEPPADIPWGEETKVKVVGYGNDGMNEGLLVELSPSQTVVYSGAPVPHITVGLNGGKAKDTWKLDFTEFGKTAEITARWGWFDGAYHYN